MIANKLNKEIKDSMNKRVRSGLLMAVYGMTVLFCLTMTDKSPDGWARYLPDNIHNYISFAFAIISILAIAWITIFIAKELHNCFIDTNNKRQIIFISVCMLLIQLVPTSIWLYPNYFSVDNKLIWFLSFFLSGVVICLICFPFLFKIVKNGKKPTKFNKLFFPILVLGIAWVLGCVYYLSIVRYWTTILILIVVVISCDITAYFAGVLFGKHKMAPTISPKKSWEGAIVGCVVAAGLVILLAFLFSLIPHPHDRFNESSMDVPYNFFGVQFKDYFSNTYRNGLWWGIIAAIAIVLTIFSVWGDLLFSWFKRKNNIKDFGNSLPGHGGFLDRIDSFTVVVAVFTIITFVVSVFTAFYHHSVQTIFPDWF